MFFKLIFDITESKPKTLSSVLSEIRKTIGFDIATEAKDIRWGKSIKRVLEVTFLGSEECVRRAEQVFMNKRLRLVHFLSTVTIIRFCLNRDTATAAELQSSASTQAVDDFVTKVMNEAQNELTWLSDRDNPGFTDYVTNEGERNSKKEYVTVHQVVCDGKVQCITTVEEWREDHNMQKHYNSLSIPLAMLDFLLKFEKALS